MSDSEPNGNKSFKVEVKVWFNEEDGRFRLVFPGDRITTVANDGGERSHPHLYAHLRSMLEDQKGSGG